MLQPSENESREFTKANTAQVQRRLAEVEAARMQRLKLQNAGIEPLTPPALGFDDLGMKLAVTEGGLRVPEMNGVRDSYTSLDNILSSYGSSDESTGAARRWNGRPSGAPERAGVSQKFLDPAPPRGEKYSYLGTAPPFHLALVTPTPSPPVEQLKGYFPPTPPGKESEGHGKWGIGVPLKTSPSSRSLDIETAFSSLGGFGSGGIWRKIGVLVILLLNYYRMSY